MTDYTEGLNPPQKEAVLHSEGPLLIVAGAGAGKTKTLTHRILRLIDSGVPPRQILAVTFTNKAAQEMRERVRSLLGGSTSRYSEPFIGTFHSLGVHILRENHALLGIPRHFTILDKNDSLSLMKESVKAKNLDPKQFDPKRIRDAISRQKGEGVSAEKYRAQIGENASAFFQRMAAEVWLEYEKRLRAEGAFDFDDLLLKTLELLRKDDGVRTKYQELWRYIHIDEYQDTNTVQYEMTRALAGKHQNICCVGDADQNIYSFRGANIKNILRFEKDYASAHTILLEENYRSTQNILSAANEVIKKNTLRVEKNLFTQKGAGEKIVCYEAYDETDEAYHIAEKIKGLLSDGILPGEIAVLFRANYQSRAIEEAMLSADIPYQVLGVKFFDRKEVKDTLAFLRAALNTDGFLDIKRIINVPPRGIGETTMKKIAAGQKDALPPAMKKKVADFETLLARIREHARTKKPTEVIKFIIKETGMEHGFSLGGEEELERLENIRELATLASKYDELPQEEGIARLLEDAALASDQDSMMHKQAGETRGLVRLMTVHASKGLEFGAVFVTGLEDGLFPHRQFGAKDASREHDEEERRLFYVALTRAKERLFLTSASVRTIFGSRQVNIPSEFLSDIGEELIEKEEREGGSGGKIIYL
ncbi:MAG: UvrD-helicase domain-containing protein [Parcubacteria group bacterium]|nr:UvrD-helicase domain-containing protein [Parcubacteria group bacterium]